jgi:hypothetical protein
MKVPDFDLTSAISAALMAPLTSAPASPATPI